MENFDISKLTPELQNLVKACKSVEELKALLASKNFAVPDEKLDAIMQLCSNSAELVIDELEKVSGGTSFSGPFCRCS